VLQDGLPTFMTDSAWFYRQEETIEGPVPLEALLRLLVDEAITLATPVREATSARWQPISAVGPIREQVLGALRARAQARPRPHPRLATPSDDQGADDTDEPIGPSAALPRRLAAGAIDTVFVLALTVGCLLVPWLGFESADPEGSLVRAAVIAAIVGWGYFTLQALSGAHATLGQTVLDLTITDSDGAPLDLAGASLHYLLSLLSVLALGAGYLAALADPHRRTLHERVARTWVADRFL
jgi:uncharacterized RDD family membrane protein YckC